MSEIPKEPHQVQFEYPTALSYVDSTGRNFYMFRTGGQSAEQAMPRRERAILRGLCQDLIHKLDEADRAECVKQAPSTVAPDSPGGWRR